MWLLSPAGLRLEIRREIDKKKMNFIFNREEKFFLTQELNRACRSEKRETACLGKFCASRTAMHSKSLQRTDLAARF
jgi:hypothetical protein